MKRATTKKFGARYGRKIRQRYAEIESQSKRKYKCPYCSQYKVKRLSVGIWQCKKCDSKFTGKAYTISKKIVLREDVKKDVEATVE